MIRKKRGYQRETPTELLRDYRLFAIACEGGKREPHYFKLFEHFSERIKVDIIEDKVHEQELLQKYETKSAPKWVLERAIKYIEYEGLIDEDELWFVMDVDRWEFAQLKEIIDYCQKSKNWNIALSNPCFEIWLYLHKHNNIDAIEASSCSDFKGVIGNLDKGGYNVLNFIHLVKDAVNNAKNLDENPDSSFPELKRTKVYQLLTSVLKFVTENNFKNFMEIKYPEMLTQQLKIKDGKKGLKK